MTLDKNKEKNINLKLLRWYRRSSRNLPWRTIKKNKLPDPYYILVSEFMLQQTTVKTVIPRFNEFVKIWPTLKKLSSTNEVRILKFWSGLGYYIRAKNLLKTAKLIAKNYNYKIPNDYNLLIQLPGIGDYTAKAILGIAYNQPVMPIDTNIKRMVTRIYGIKSPIRDIKSQIISYSEKLIFKKYSSNFIQSLMDYGSTKCLLSQPKCEKCIIQNSCIAYRKNLTSIIPLRKFKINSKPIKLTRAYIIINEHNEIVVRRRSSSGMLQSMVEIPNDLWVNKKKQLERDGLIKLISKKFNKIKKSLIYSFSHFDLNVEIYFTKIKKRKFIKHRWLSLLKIDNSGMPTIMKKIIKHYLKYS